MTYFKLINCKIMLILFLIFDSFLCLAAAPLQNINNYKLSFTLPIEATTNPKTHLAINIPSNLAGTSEGILAFFNRQIPLVNFGPKDEPKGNFYEKSFYVGVQTLIGSRISADSEMRWQENKIRSKSKQFKIIRQKVNTHGNFIFSESIFQYMYPNEGPRLVFARFYSGRYDCVKVFYNTKISHWLSNQEALEKAAEIEAKVNSFTKVVYF